VTVTNVGIVNTLSNLALAVPAGFQLVNNTCSATLGPGLSCNAGVEFAPTVAGAQAGNLTVTSATVTTGVLVPLQGMGFDFTVAFSGSNLQSVAGGQTADYTLVLTPLQSGSGTFALACGSLPKDAVCVFNPPSETLNSGVAGNVIVGVSTGSATGSLTGNDSRAGRRKASGGWGVVPLVCGLLLLPLGWRRNRRMMKTAGRVALLVLLLAFLAGGVASCTISGGGGGSGPGSGDSGQTPAGTYTIPVVVTSMGVSHSVTVTLVVD
jgi:hypothetical protein